MRVLHVISSLEIGGAQRLLSELLPIQSQHADVSLLVYERLNNDFEEKIVGANIPILSLNEHNFYNPKIILRLRKFFKDFDVVHAHLFPTLYWASLASVGLKVKLVYTEHSTTNSRRGKWYFNPIERFIYSKYNRIISISQQTQEALQKWLKSKDERFKVINNGVNIETFRNVHSSVIPKSIIMISRFAMSKDQETLIRAMKFVDSEVILRLVGDGETINRCKEIAVSEGVKDRVQFLGNRSDIADLIAESYIGVQSSNWEGFGLTAVELMAGGKPVIASDVDGLKQIVDGAGILFPKGNDVLLGKAINKLINNRDYYNEVSAKCNDRSLNYDISRTSEKYIELYENIMGNS